MNKTPIFDKINYIYYSDDIEIDIIKNKIIEDYPNRTALAYDLELNNVTQIINGKQIKYKNTILFTTLKKYNQKSNGISIKLATKCNTLLFIFSKTSISKNELTIGSCIISPTVKIFNCNDLLKTLNIHENRNNWFIIKSTNNINIIANEIKFKNYNNIFIKKEDFDKNLITKEEYIEYSIDNPIDFDYQIKEELQIFF